MLDAGEKFQRSKFWTHVKPWEGRERIARGEQPLRFEVDIKEQPYTYTDGQPFDLIRVWGRGGKTNVWGRVSLRYSDLDFASAERDGWEIPWPIRYKDIAPYYDRVDQLIGVYGGDDDQDSLPGSQFICPRRQCAAANAAAEGRASDRYQHRLRPPRRAHASPTTAQRLATTAAPAARAAT